MENLYLHLFYMTLVFLFYLRYSELQEDFEEITDDYLNLKRKMLKELTRSFNKWFSACQKKYNLLSKK